MEGDMYRNILITFHTSMSREMFSCLFCTKIPDFAERNSVFCRFCALHSALREQPKVDMRRCVQ